MSTKPERRTKHLKPWKASSTSSSTSPQITPAETPPNGTDPNSQTLEDEIAARMGNTAEGSKSQEGIKTPESESSKLDKEIEPPTPEVTPPKLATKEKDAITTKAKKTSCKQQKKSSKKSKKSKKANEVESSSSEDTSSDSSSSDSSESPSSDSSSDEDEAAKRKKKAKAKRAKKLKAKKKAAKKAKEEHTDSDSDSEDESSSSEDEKKKSKKKKALKRKKQAKKNKKAEAEEEEDEAEDDTYAQQLAQLQALRGLGRGGRAGIGGETLGLEAKAAKKTKKKPGKKSVYPCVLCCIPALQRVMDYPVIYEPVLTRYRGSKAAFVRVDRIWDSTRHNYVLKATAEDLDVGEYDQYVFQVRRKFDWENKYLNTVVDIKSKALKEALKDVMSEVKGVSFAEETPVIDPNMLFLYLEEIRAWSKHLKKFAKSEKKKKGKIPAKTKAKHLKVLIKYLDKDYAETKKTLYPLLENNTITFDLLWALFKSNEIAYCPTYGNVDEPRAFKIEYANLVSVNGG